MSDKGKPAKTYFFFVGDDKYETELSAVSGAYIKARLADLPQGAMLSLEGHGNDPDLPFGDADEISLELGHGHGPRHFAVVPPASFG
jgi:hypothetical protein